MIIYHVGRREVRKAVIVTVIGQHFTLKLKILVLIATRQRQRDVNEPPISSTESSGSASHEYFSRTSLIICSTTVIKTSSLWNSQLFLQHALFSSLTNDMDSMEYDQIVQWAEVVWFPSLCGGLHLQ